MKIAHGIKVAHLLAVTYGMILGDLGGASVITRVLKWEEGGRRGQSSVV